MPAPNPNNPYHCDRPMRRNGKQKKSGAQTYRCKCGFSCTEGDRPAHPPTIGDEPMTQVERNRRYRLNQKYKAKKIMGLNVDKNGSEIDDGLNTCSYCGGKYDPESEGHTELDEEEEETGNCFCSPECEANHYKDLGKRVPRQIF
jgi:hypothetical protein